MNTIGRPLPGAGDLLRQTLPPGSLAVKRPPVLADVRSPVLEAEIDARLKVAEPITMHNAGSGFKATVQVAPLTHWQTHDDGANGQPRRLDAWA